MSHGYRLIYAVIALILIFLIGVFGYHIIGGPQYSLLDCLYMTVITLAGVGYGEIIDMSNNPVGRSFTIILIFSGMGVLLYAVSSATAFIVEGDLKKILESRRMEKKIKKFKNHYIICGAGKTGIHIIEEMLKLDQDFVAIDSNQELVEKLRNSLNISIIEGDADDDEVLIRAGIESAYGLITVLPNDKDNLFVTITARQLNSKLKIVAKCIDLNTKNKLLIAGANSVVSPNVIGGLRMVSEMIRPTVVSFLDVMMRDPKAVYRIEEILIDKGSPCVGKKIKDAGIREKTSVLVLAIKNNYTEECIYIPSPEIKITEGVVLIVLGSKEDVKKLREMIQEPVKNMIIKE